MRADGNTRMPSQRSPPTRLGRMLKQHSGNGLRVAARSPAPRNRRRRRNPRRQRRRLKRNPKSRRRRKRSLSLRRTATRRWSPRNASMLQSGSWKRADTSIQMPFRRLRLSHLGKMPKRHSGNVAKTAARSRVPMNLRTTSTRKSVTMQSLQMTATILQSGCWTKADGSIQMPSQRLPSSRLGKTPKKRSGSVPRTVARSPAPMNPSPRQKRRSQRRRRSATAPFRLKTATTPRSG
mmetsp:Transcript_133464/g.316378  ORF Transcript_133464/g.316378 Transcript_133464/m.316378 type:complete len:236 (+) Transcript_133464:239-946(+)